MAKLAGSSLEPSYEAPRAGDVPHSLADVSAAKQALGYDPSVGLDEGLSRTLKFYEMIPA